uniref:Reverse transcriptase domain-containing protein n=1 Tax=Tanacetum cinerariifolium TaxID=118510 RepID=A0A6L2LCH9_TANCI|nr:hypothetical protein [Tanacetum cinerariifolium]
MVISVLLLVYSFGGLDVSVVEEGAGESVLQVLKERLLLLLAREVCKDVRKVGEYRKMSRELEESVRRLNVFIAELRALGNYGDDYESLRFLERMQLESMEKGVHLRFIDEGDSSGDKMVWTDSFNVELGFSVSNVWECIRIRFDKVDWHHVVWEHLKRFTGFLSIPSELNAIVDFIYPLTKMRVFHVFIDLVMDQKHVEGEELFRGVANRMNKLTGKGEVTTKNQRAAARVLNPSSSSCNVRTQEVSTKICTVSSSINQHGRNNDGVQSRVFENPIAYREPRVSESSKQNVSKDSKGNMQSQCGGLEPIGYVSVTPTITGLSKSDSLVNPTSLGESLTVNPSRECVIEVEEVAGLAEGDGISVSRMTGSFVLKDPNLDVNNIAATTKVVANEKSYTSLGESTIRSMMNPSYGSKSDVEEGIWSTKDPPHLVSEVNTQPGISINMTSIVHEANEFGYIRPTRWNLTNKYNVPTENDGDAPITQSVDINSTSNSYAEAAVIEKVSVRLEHTLYGYFIGKRMAFPVVEYYARNNWAKHGLKRIMMNAKGFFFFKFDSRAGLDAVLEAGLWKIRNSPILLKKWSVNTSLQKEEMAYILIWVKLHDVSIQVFEEDGISLIASYLEAEFTESITIGIPELEGSILLRKLFVLNMNESLLDAIHATFSSIWDILVLKRWAAIMDVEMERGFLNNGSHGMENDEGKSGKTGSLLHDLASKVKNIDGKILGKNGKPLKAYQSVQFADVDLNSPVSVKGMSFPTKSDHVINVSANFATRNDGTMASPLRRTVTFANRDEAAILNDGGVPKDTSEVTKVPVWVKLHSVPVLAYSDVGLSLIATQIGKPIMLDAFTSLMCVESWGCIGFAHEEEVDGHSREVIRVEYEWKPPHCVECKCFGQESASSPKRAPNVSGLANSSTNVEEKDEGFIEVKRLKNKGKKINTKIDGIRFTKPKEKFYREKTSSLINTKVPSPFKSDMNPQLSNTFDVLNTVEEVIRESGDKGVDPIVGSDSQNQHACNLMGSNASDEESEVEEYPSSLGISSTGGDFALEDDDLDCYDGYEAQIYNLSGNLQETLYPKKAPKTNYDGGSTREATSSKVGSSSYSNEGASVVHNVTSFDKQKDKDVVDTGVMKISNISSLNPCTVLGEVEDEDEDIENVYDESNNLNLIHNSGASTPPQTSLMWMLLLFMILVKRFVAGGNRLPMGVFVIKVLGSLLAGMMTLHARLMRNRPWVLLGDFNAALNIEDHSSGGSEPNVTMRDFKECIQAMENVHIEGYAVYRVVKRLKGLKSPFCKLLHDHGNLHDWVNKIRVELDEAHKAIDRDPSSSVLREEHAHYLLVFKEAHLDKERFLKQKAKVEWLKVGDSNTSYFHKIVKSKCARNRIEMVSDSSNTFYNGNQVPSAFVKHYNQFLGAEGVSNPLDAHDLFTRVLDNSKVDCMVRDVTYDEIKSVMFSMGDDRAPGFNGFTDAFFKKAWDVMGGDITYASRDFFSNGKLLKELNHTIISLIPKVTTPARINDYRPISCCNVLYKCISKIIANRVKEGLGDIVSINQSAFVPGRRISDNILLTQKLMRNYHMRRGPPRCALKVDIQKAYDTVDWNFLETILVGFGFHPKMYHHLCEQQRIINLCFANDLFLFARGHPGSVSVIMDALEEFKQVSCLVPSIPKSTAYFCNVPNAIKASILNSMPFAEGEMKKGKAKVAWDSVCMPTHEGGLGIRRIKDFNIALMATHIWSILTHRESLWVKWVHTYKLKGRSFWDVLYRGDASWGWHVFPLKDLLSNRDIVRSGFSLDDSVSNLISYGVWRWPLDWLSRFPFLAQLHVPVLLDDMDDVILWRDRDGVLRPFSVACVWDTIRSRADIVNWYNVVWFSHCIPHHAIHMWLVIQQKLKTQGRLRQWDVGSSIDLNLLKCPLCDLVPDYHDHLFFECSFSSQVWSKVRVLCGMDVIPPHLSDIVAFIVPLSKGKTVVSILFRIAIAATSYYIWLERNVRLFKKKTLTPDQIIDVIFSTMRLKLVTFKFKKMSTKSRLLLDQ